MQLCAPMTFGVRTGCGPSSSRRQLQRARQPILAPPRRQAPQRLLQRLQRRLPVLQRRLIHLPQHRLIHPLQRRLTRPLQRQPTRPPQRQLTRLPQRRPTRPLRRRPLRLQTHRRQHLPLLQCRWRSAIAVPPEIASTGLMAHPSMDTRLNRPAILHLFMWSLRQPPGGGINYSSSLIAPGSLPQRFGGRSSGTLPIGRPCPAMVNAGPLVCGMRMAARKRGAG